LHKFASKPSGKSTRGYAKEVNDDQLKFLRSLRAVREYTPAPVSDEALQDILEVGRWTATGGNRQAHEVIVVRDPAVRAKFAAWGAKPAGPAQVALLIVTSSEHAVFDEGRVAERLALAAKACGLGSCVATLKNEGPEQAKQLLGIPADRRAQTMVTIGHTDVEARKALPKAAQARRPMTEFAHFNHY
jgi:nitroreductase